MMTVVIYDEKGDLWLKTSNKRVSVIAVQANVNIFIILGLTKSSSSLSIQYYIVANTFDLNGKSKGNVPLG